MAKDADAEFLFGRDNNPNGRWEAQRRFVSPEFNPIYRQGFVGPHRLPEAEFSRFLQLARSSEVEAAELLVAWSNRPRQQGGDFGDVAIDRIGARASQMDAQTATGITAVFAEVMDDYFRRRPPRSLFADLWQQTESILKTFRAEVEGFTLGGRSNALAAEGAAISWMICTLGAAELANHGLLSERSGGKPSMTHAQLEAFLRRLAARVDKLAPDSFLDLPLLARVLFILQNSPWTAKTVARTISRYTGPRASDERFLRFMVASAGLVISSNRGAYHTISFERLGRLVGAERLERRWQELKIKPLSGELASLREQVLSWIANSRD